MDPKPKPCRYELAQRGSCRRGPSCYFSHDLDNRRLVEEADRFTDTISTLTNPQLNDRRSAIPCTFFKRGSCTRGEQCSFSHDLQPQAHEEYAIEALKVDDDTSTAVIDGLSVTFGSGAKINKIVLPQQYSTVSLSGLPANTTSSQSGFLSLLRLYADPDKTIVKLSRTSSGTTALVTVEDPYFADTICQGLSRELAESLGCPSVVVTKVPASFSTGLSKQRITRSVICSWLKATCQVTLYYLSELSAHMAFGLFRSVHYMLHGKRLRTAQSKVRGAGTELWKVFLYHAPLSTNREDIEAVLSADSLQPFTLDISKATYGDDIEVTNKVRRVLEQIGPLIAFDLHPTTGSLHKATAIFTSDLVDSAKALSLDQTHLMGEHVKLSTKLQVTTKVRVLTSVLDSISMFDTFVSATRNDSSVNVNIFRNNDASQRLTTIMLTSCDESELSRVKTELDKLLATKIALNNQI